MMRNETSVTYVVHISTETVPSDTSLLSYHRCVSQGLPTILYAVTT